MSYLLPRGAFSRRDFLKVAGAAGAGLVMAPSLLAAGKKGGDAPAANGTPFYQFVNATKGAFTDDQIGWAWDDRGPFTPLSQAATAPNGNGKGNGRLYFQLKNNKGEWKDFIEWAGGGNRWNGNTTQVDEFIIPMTIEMGNKKLGITESRAKLFEAFLKECPKEFKNCVIGDKAIVSPFKADMGTGKPFANYFEQYVAEAMPGSNTKPRPRTSCWAKAPWATTPASAPPSTGTWSRTRPTGGTLPSSTSRNPATGTPSSSTSTPSTTSATASATTTSPSRRRSSAAPATNSSSPFTGTEPAVPMNTEAGPPRPLFPARFFFVCHGLLANP